MPHRKFETTHSSVRPLHEAIWTYSDKGTEVLRSSLNEHGEVSISECETVIENNLRTFSNCSPQDAASKFSSTACSIMSNSADDGGQDFDSGSDSVSTTSTVEYTQESFMTYSERVRNLLSALYGEGCAASATISRRTGGSFNRIIRVHLPSANDATEDLILRIPRFDNIDVGRDIVQQSGVLCGLRPFLPVPEVAALGRVVSQPIRASLHDYAAHPRRNTVQYSGWFKPVGKMRIAAQVARLISAIHSVPVPQAVGSLSVDEGGRLTVARITRHDEGLDTATLDSKSPPKFIRDFISVRTSEIRDWSAQRWPGVKFIPGLCDKLHEASEKLLKDVTFSERNVLFHRDLAARNLIVHREAPDAQWKITGVLDWDDADVGPLELASIWPDWLWAHEDQSSSEFYVFERDPDKPCTAIIADGFELPLLLRWSGWMLGMSIGCA
ncbi:hypothetical protein HGRIS_003260 [Hohenbuehelia grisea]|uniref:Aminoglycoside phosphotransferase domain-containing protein n=1 Tax=Hohenbuehelia grisea TaxID=104357 RepID=A0ABR3JMW6_9AGAR